MKQFRYKNQERSSPRVSGRRGRAIVDAFEAFIKALPAKKPRTQRSKKAILASITEKNGTGKERTWRLELLTGEAVKIERGGFYWVCNEPPHDLDYDYPALCWNYRAPMKSPAKAKAWLLKCFIPGGPGYTDGWITHHTVIAERVAAVDEPPLKPGGTQNALET